MDEKCAFCTSTLPLVANRFGIRSCTVCHHAQPRGTSATEGAQPLATRSDGEPPRVEPAALRQSGDTSVRVGPMDVGTWAGEGGGIAANLACYTRARGRRTASGVIFVYVAPHQMATAARRAWLDLQLRAERVGGPLAVASAPGLWAHEMTREAGRLAFDVPEPMSADFVDHARGEGVNVVAFVFTGETGFACRDLAEHAAVRGCEVRKCRW